MVSYTGRNLKLRVSISDVGCCGGAVKYAQPALIRSNGGSAIMEEKQRENPEEMMGKSEPLEAQAKTKGPSEEAAQKKEYVEEREVRAGQLLDTIEDLLRESSVRRIRIKNKAGRILIDIPVWAAAAGGTVALYLAPVLSILSLFGGLLAGFTVEVVREVEEKEGEAA
ncbi:MAG: DUF4342 domain-containing protein [Actinobacteria bacterium]|nr:DUF4342 domain-containing protein [Actinomycetota bacterium]